MKRMVQYEENELVLGNKMQFVPSDLQNVRSGKEVQGTQQVQSTRETQSAHKTRCACKAKGTQDKADSQHTRNVQAPHGTRNTATPRKVGSSETFEAKGPARPITERRLRAQIAPSFYSVHRDAQAHRHVHYLLSGGRGSCKSTFVALEILLLLQRNPLCHALVMRKVATTLRDSVYGQYVWALELLGLCAEYEQRLSPLELVSRRTGQRILFRGADDKAKIKSLKMKFGYLGITHFEEKDQFESRAELRTILQSTMRGGTLFWNFETCNPPQRLSHWANVDALCARDDTLYHHSDYRSVPFEWLGEQFFAEAEQLRLQNEEAYAHEYLGLATGGGAQVFCNVALRDISASEIADFDRVYRGVDWGYFPDPFAMVVAHYDAARRTLYVFDEICAQRKSNAETAELAKKKGAAGENVWADSAEPKSIADWRSMGIICRGVKKGAGSVPYSMKWLASLASIVVDPARCPHTARELTQYEFAKDAAGALTDGYPDRDNHHIDALRYAMFPVWKRKGQ